MMTGPIRTGATIVVAAAFLAIAGSATAAGNESPTEIAFASKEPTSATFGSDWLIEVRVAPKEGADSYYFPGPIGSDDGTVDFRISGKPGAFADDIPIFPGGVAYLTQPDDQDLLEPGTYSVSAIFTPDPSSDFATSKTSVSAELTIRRLTVTPQVELIDNPAVAPVPTVRTSLSGSYLTTTGAPPAGEWNVSATSADGTSVFSQIVAQPTEAESGTVGPLDIPLTAEFAANQTYTITAVFEPAESIASGLLLDETKALSLKTAPPTISERLAAPIPLWMLIAAAVAVALAAALTIVMAVRAARRLRRAAEATDSGTVTPAAPAMAALAAAPRIDTDRHELTPLPPIPPREVDEPAGGESDDTPWPINDLFADETAPHEVPQREVAVREAVLRDEKRDQ